MKRRFDLVANTHALQHPSVHSTSSDDLSRLDDFTSDSSSRNGARNVRRRTAAAPGLTRRTGTAYSSSFTSCLQDILTRYQQWSTAVVQGNTGVSDKALSELKHGVAKGCCSKDKHTCTLCLEHIEEGEEYTTLACGHVFHKGRAHKFQNMSTAESVAAAKNEESKQGCKGILYWLKSSLTCPQCRTELEPAVPIPSASEQVIVPLLNRQFALIQAQARLIERLRRDLHSETGKKRKRNKPSATNTQSGLALPSSMTTESVRPLSRNGRSSRQWQDGVQHNVYRMHILTRVTKIARSVLNWHMGGHSLAKIRKLNTLAAKVELLLFSEASSLEEYKDVETLDRRVLGKIQGLIYKAKALRRVRDATAVPSEVSSLVF